MFDDHPLLLQGFNPMIILWNVSYKLYVVPQARHVCFRRGDFSLSISDSLVAFFSPKLKSDFLFNFIDTKISIEVSDHQIKNCLVVVLFCDNLLSQQLQNKFRDISPCITTLLVM
jgi:hypothetical protein